MGKSTISMAMFNSYVSLPEGITNLSDIWVCLKIIKHMGLNMLKASNMGTWPSKIETYLGGY